MLRINARIAGVAACTAALLLAGCSEVQLVAHSAKRVSDATEQPERQDTGTYKVGKPYQVAGSWYYPKADYSYRETGIASWYGPGFDGKTTANGETYDQDGLTAAHRTLPMPSMVRVTNLENGRSLKLRVNDRGPFARGRIIDVSRRAADLLGFLEDGTAKVRVTVVEGESRRLASGALNREAADRAPEAVPTVAVDTARLDTRADAAPASTAAPRRTADRAADRRAEPEPSGVLSYENVGSSAIFVQAGSFVSYDNASRLGRRLASLGPVKIAPAKVNDRQFYRVRVGPVESVNRADRLLQRLVQKGYSESQVVVVE